VFRKLSAVAGLTTVLFLLSLSLTYACPDLGRVDSAPRRALMHDGMPQETPCGEQKQEICDFLHDSFLSIQASSYRATNIQQSILFLVPIPHFIGISDQIACLSDSAIWQIAFHSVFKIPLSLSSSVLRV
jgi:hypothetical protein